MKLKPTKLPMVPTQLKRRLLKNQKLPPLLFQQVPPLLPPLKLQPLENQYQLQLKLFQQRPLKLLQMMMQNQLKNLKSVGLHHWVIPVVQRRIKLLYMIVMVTGVFLKMVIGVVLKLEMFQKKSVGQKVLVINVVHIEQILPILIQQIILILVSLMEIGVLLLKRKMNVGLMHWITHVVHLKRKSPLLIFMVNGVF